MHSVRKKAKKKKKNTETLNRMMQPESKRFLIDKLSVIASFHFRANAKLCAWSGKWTTLDVSLPN